MQKTIYMLEDDQDDRLLTDEIMDDLALPVTIRYFSNSVELTEAMEKELPSLVLMDFNAPPSGALAAIREIRKTVSSHVPLVILTESKTNANRDACYREGASSVITKPTTMEATKKRVEGFFRYWLEVAEI